MTTILFESIGGGETETPPPDATGSGSLTLRCIGYGEVIGGMGTMSLRLRMGGVGEGGSELDEPFMAIGEGVLRLIAGYSYGPEVAEPAEMEGSLRLVGGFASGGTGYSTDAVGDMQFTLNGGGLGPYPEDEGGGGGEEGPGFEPDYEGVFLSDEFAVDDTVSDLLTMLLTHNIALSDSIRGEWTASALLSETMSLSNQLAGIYRELLTSSMEFEGALEGDHIAIVQMMDTLMLAGVVSTEMEAKALLIEAIAFGSLLSAAEVLTLLSGIGFSEAVQQSYVGAARMVDALLLQAEQTATATFVVLMRDGVDLSSSVVAAAELLAALRDGLGFVGRMFTDTEEYVAWAMNTTSKGMTRFTNYPFNSFMTVGGNTYGIAPHGRFKLGGDTDDGEAINASLRMGMSAMGTQKLKGISAAYLGYAASGKLQLRVITTSQVDGLREAYVYTLHPKFADSPRESRIKVGQGLEAVYYDFELVNVDGADFDIDIVEIHTIPLSRRIRGNAGAKP